MNDPSSTHEPLPDDIEQRLQESESLERRVRRLTLALRALLLVVLIALFYLGFRFPAASLPALLVALIAFYRNRSMAAPPSLKDWLDTDPPSMEELAGRDESLFGRILAWSLPGGAIGYAGLAAAGIGVPAPEVAVGWRLFGGLVVGAMAGVAAAWAVCTSAVLIEWPRAA
jgi:hypothetical protein